MLPLFVAYSLRLRNLSWAVCLPAHRWLREQPGSAHRWHNTNKLMKKCIKKRNKVYKQQANKLAKNCAQRSIPVRVGLEGAIDPNTNVIGLLFAQFRHLSTKRGQMQIGNLLI